ncbi:MAG: hypothetical protein HY051_00265 [Candidatus Aenigmarchaeota archaeon]|nr:hypothetical protein [Candidatus Aenigmarchaeota archaeon]
MIITRLIYSIKDKDTQLAEGILDELHEESKIHVDKIGAREMDFVRYIKKHSIKRFPVIVVTNSDNGIEMKVEGENHFKNREKLRETLSNMFLKLVYLEPQGEKSE